MEYKRNNKNMFGNVITLKDLHIGQDIVGDTIVSVGVKPVYKYVNGKVTIEVIGCDFNCFAPEKGNKKFHLKVYGDVDLAKYKDMIHKKGIVQLEVIEFKGKFFEWKEKVLFTAVAKEVKVVC